MRGDENQGVAESLPAGLVPEHPAQAGNILEEWNPLLLETFGFGRKSADHRRLTVGEIQGGTC